MTTLRISAAPSPRVLLDHIRDLRVCRVPIGSTLRNRRPQKRNGFLIIPFTAAPPEVMVEGFRMQIIGIAPRQVVVFISAP
jgi:hypothetical protein